MSYRHLKIRERESIARLYPVVNMARIAVVIGRSRATVKREIDRNGYRDEEGNWCYDAQIAQHRSERRKAYLGCGKGHRFFKNSWAYDLYKIRKPYEPPVYRFILQKWRNVKWEKPYYYPPPFEKRWRWFRSDDERIRWRTERGEQNRKPYEYRWKSPYHFYLNFDKRTDERNREGRHQWFLKRNRESKAFWKKEFCDPAFYNQVNNEFWLDVTSETQSRKIPKRITPIPFPSRLRQSYSPACGAVLGRSMSEAKQNRRFLKNEPTFLRDNPVLFLKSA